jgi:hypothetical protein
MEVARGETDGTVWRLEAQPVEGGVWLGHGICVELKLPNSRRGVLR